MDHFQGMTSGSSIPMCQLFKCHEFAEAIQEDLDKLTENPKVNLTC